MKKLIILLFLFLLLPLTAFPLDVVTYYFNSYDSGEKWKKDAENIVDGDEDNAGNTNEDADVNLCDGNTGDGTDLGTISKVEIRAKIASSDEGSMYIRPIFSGSDDGDNHSVYTSSRTLTWTDYIDITSDTNAPETWIWSGVQSLDCDLESHSLPRNENIQCSKVEIQVTYETVATTVEPTVLPLTMTLESPTISDFALVSPSVLQLTMSLHSPTVTATDFTKIYGATIYGATLN